MKKCMHPEHQDAYVDPETGWIITGEEAYFPHDWNNHPLRTVGRPRKYANDKEKWRAGHLRAKARRQERLGAK